MNPAIIKTELCKSCSSPNCSGKELQRFGFPTCICPKLKNKINPEPKPEIKTIQRVANKQMDLTFKNNKV